ncbi:Alpha/Beta hydrolase protein [Gaertneriomyces semiglobifer]|nr:Alpha/Beta hydrolase protein [Gaertneriomyces semiglobifer]
MTFTTVTTTTPTISSVTVRHPILRYLNWLDQKLHLLSRRLWWVPLYAIHAAVHTSIRRLIVGRAFPNWSWWYEVSLQFIQWLLRGEYMHVRRAMEVTSWTTRKTLPGISVENVRGPDMKGCWIRPKPTSNTDTSKPISIFVIHGGGYYFGSPLMHLRSLALLLKGLTKAGRYTQIFCVDYPLSPEVAFPTHLDYVTKAYDIFARQVGGNTIVMGDSAGGALALQILHHVQQTGGTPPMAAVLISPWVTKRHGGADYKETDPYDFLCTPLLNGAVERYFNTRAPSQQQLTNPLVSPCFHKLADYGDVPMLVTYGTAEALGSDIKEWILRMQGDGAKMEVDVGVNMVHEYQLLEEFFGKEARGGIERIKTWIARTVQPQLAVSK